MTIYKAPWQGVGTDVITALTLDQAAEEAGIDFTVAVRQSYFFHDEETLDQAYKAKGYYNIVKVKEGQYPVALGQCKSRFSPLQNSELLKFVKPLIDEGIVSLDIIGMFGEGEKVWVLCKVVAIPYQIVAGDTVELYLLLINTHDGTSKVMIGIVPIRVICSNMFSMLKHSEFDLVKFKHVGDVDAKLQAVRTNIDEQLAGMNEFCTTLRTMCMQYPTSEQLDEYFRAVFKIKEDASTKSENKIKRLKELFVLGAGNQAINVRGTWYAAYNAVSEYLNYEAGRSVDTRLNSLWLGTNNDTNTLALELAYAKALATSA